MSIKTKAALKAQNTAVILENVNEEITATVMHNHLEDIIDSMRDVSAFNIGDLSDVSVSTATNGQVLSYSGGTWRASTISTTSGTSTLPSGSDYSIQIKSGSTFYGNTSIKYDYDSNNLSLNNSVATTNKMMNSIVSNIHTVLNAYGNTAVTYCTLLGYDSTVIVYTSGKTVEANLETGYGNRFEVNDTSQFNTRFNLIGGHTQILKGAEYCSSIGYNNRITNMQYTHIIGKNIVLDGDNDTDTQLYVNAITATDSLDDDYTRWFQLGRDGSVGSWRFTNYGTSLVLQVWDGANWTTKDTWTA